VLSGSLDWNSYDNGGVGNTMFGDTLNTQLDRTINFNYTHIFTPTLMNTFGISHTWFTAGSQFKNTLPSSWGLYAPLNAIIPRILMYTQGYQIFTIGADGPLSHRQ